MKKITGFSIVIIIIIVRLGWWLLFPNITINQNPVIDLDPNISLLIELGCIEKNNEMDCSVINLSEQYSCRNLQKPEYLGGLSPSTNIVECLFQKENYSINEGIVGIGCLAPFYTKYIVLLNNKFHEIKTKEAFQEFFEPVDSPKEALSYAVALTGSYPMFEINIPKNYRTYVSNLETTYVKVTDAGFVVHLFDYLQCGCGPHPHFYVDYLVTKEGDVREITRKKIYENPMLDGLCVD